MGLCRDEELIFHENFTLIKDLILYTVRFILNLVAQNRLGNSFTTNVFWKKKSWNDLSARLQRDKISYGIKVDSRKGQSGRLFEVLDSHSHERVFLLDFKLF